MADEALRYPAPHPLRLPLKLWRAVGARVMREAERDHLALIAAGVAFFGLLALFPGLASLVALYRLLGDPNDIGAQMAILRGIAPGPMLDLLHEQLLRLMRAPAAALATQGVLATVLAFWASQQGVRSLLRGLNIAYGGLARRGIVRRTALGVWFSLAALALAALLIATFSLTPATMVGLGVPVWFAFSFLQWPLLAASIVGFALALYRWGPNRRAPGWVWLTPGALLAAVLWLLASWLFTLYAQAFAGYGQIYGSLAGVVLLLLWLFVSAFAILLGAELNAELEKCCIAD